jgi:aspartate/methionine/tyrosine aminotransferase
MTNDAYCVKAYQVIRDGVGGDAVRISEGRNLFPPSTTFLRQVAKLTERLLASDRLTSYESAADEKDRELMANLLANYLRYPGIEARHVLFTNGSQEAISIVTAFCAAQGLSAVLPLPTYYSYEQSSLRWGVPLNGYYRADGRVKWLSTPADDLFQVIVLPNFVTGEVFDNPRLDSRRVRLTLVDCIYQLGAFGGSSELARITRAAVSKFPLEELVLLFTVSKDLSLPGLRASVLVTGNEALLKFAREDRFERVYSVNPLLGQIMATYTALLLMNEARDNDASEREYRNLSHKFADAGVPLPSLPDFLSLSEHFDVLTEHCRENLRALTSLDCPLDVDLQPFAGYSIFPRLRRHFENSEELLHWANYAGREHGLKLNPAYIFGGKPELWEELYPGEARVRVNLSYPQAKLRDALQRLTAATRLTANLK